MKYKILSEKMINKIEAEVKMMLHAHRDCLRNKFVGKHVLDASDPKTISFDCRDGYYGESFGIMRGLEVLGYGYFGSVNLDGTKEKGTIPIHNLKWWFSEIERKVLREENWKGSGECDYCLVHYGKDDAGRTMTIEERMNRKYGK
jgi:hypothetical protein